MAYKYPWITFVIFFVLAPAVWGESAHDVLLGNGTAGPYALSWKQFADRTETVRINTLSQMRNLDYTVDANAGTITFARPIPAQSAAEVSYDYDPAHAVRTNARLTIPLGFDLARGEHGNLSLDAVYKGTGSGSYASGSGALAVGLGGGWQTAKTQFKTRLLFAPALNVEAASTSTPSDSLARAGVALSGVTQANRRTRFSFGFSRVGTDLGQAAGDNGWQAGTETLTLGTDLAPSRRVAAFVHYTKADPLATPGRQSAQIATGLTVTPADTLQLQTHWTQSTVAGSVMESGDLSVSAQPTRTLSLEAAGQTSAGRSGTTQAANIKVNAQPTTSAQIAASFSTHDAPGLSNDGQVVNLSAHLAPSKVVALNASTGRTRQGLLSTDQQQVSLAVTPRAQFQLHSGLLLRQTDQLSTSAATFDGAFQPVSFVQFSGAYTNRTAPLTDTVLSDTLDSSTAQVALTPLRGIRLTGHYAQNPDDGGTPQRLAQHGLGLETTLGALSLTGGYDWSCQYDAATIGTTLNLGLGLHLSRALQITGGYKQTLTGVGVSPTGTSLYTVGVTHNLGDRFNLAMNGTMKQTVGPVVSAAPDYAASANLGMKF